MPAALAPQTTDSTQVVHCILLHNIRYMLVHLFSVEPPASTWTISISAGPAHTPARLYTKLFLVNLENVIWKFFESSSRTCFTCQFHLCFVGERGLELSKKSRKGLLGGHWSKQRIQDSGSQRCGISISVGPTIMNIEFPKCLEKWDHLWPHQNRYLSGSVRTLWNPQKDKPRCTHPEVPQVGILLLVNRALVK